ncbi:MAG: class IV adenylate cyclase [Terriglobales bacterium]
MTVEIELKLPIRHPRSLRARLRRLGFLVTRKRTLESNWLFDDARARLRAQGKLLRLRQAGAVCLLTAKGPRQPGLLKRRQEVQTTVADGPACRQLLELAGFAVSGHYQLWRTLLRRPGQTGTIAWDQTRLGPYLEIEGSARWVRHTALTLGLDPAAAEHRSYPDLLMTRPPRGRKSTAPQR